MILGLSTRGFLDGFSGEDLALVLEEFCVVEEDVASGHITHATNPSKARTTTPRAILRRR